jgi:hypothetical protein
MKLEQPFYIECDCPQCELICKTNSDTCWSYCEFNKDDGFVQTMFCNCGHDFELKFRVNFLIESSKHDISFEQNFDHKN